MFKPNFLFSELNASLKICNFFLQQRFNISSSLFSPFFLWTL